MSFILFDLWRGTESLTDAYSLLDTTPYGSHEDFRKFSPRHAAKADLWKLKANETQERPILSPVLMPDEPFELASAADAAGNNKIASPSVIISSRHRDDSIACM